MLRSDQSRHLNIKAFVFLQLNSFLRYCYFSNCSDSNLIKLSKVNHYSLKMKSYFKKKSLIFRLTLFFAFLENITSPPPPRQYLLSVLGGHRFSNLCHNTFWHTKHKKTHIGKGFCNHIIFTLLLRLHIPNVTPYTVRRNFFGIH